jgi:hypothetical protein
MDQAGEISTFIQLLHHDITRDLKASVEQVINDAVERHRAVVKKEWHNGSVLYSYGFTIA